MTTNDDYVMYILMNDDLKMGKGKLCAQASHASCKVVEKMMEIKSNNTLSYYDTWNNSGHAKIVLKTNEQTMNELISQYDLEQNDINPIENNWCLHIRDFGYTQIPKNSLTCVAFRPIKKRYVPTIIKNLKLL